MKYVKLFENFLLSEGVSDSEGRAASGEFDFFPFVQQGADLSSYRLPETMTLSEMQEFSDIPDQAFKPGKGAGLFICHKKDSPNSFLRAVARSFSPLTFDIAKYSLPDFQPVWEKTGINTENLPDVLGSSYGAEMMNSLQKGWPELYDYLQAGDPGGAEAAALLGGKSF